VPDFTDERGCSALCLATRNGRQDAVEWLVKVGCNLDVQDRSGSTSLIHAVLGDQCKCGATLVSFLIIKNEKEHTPPPAPHYICSPVILL
jgi:ankyrin repeat protein